MLTRLEVDGFKNLKNFSVDLGPYACIVGRNAVGKSNIFDAISFFGSTANASLNDAAANLRGLRGEISEIFGNGTNSITFAAEMIVPATFRDDFGLQVEIATTFLRYELEFHLVEQEFAANQVVRTIELVREDLKALTRKDAHARHPWASEAFRRTAIKSTGGRPAFIKTTSENSIEVVSGRRGAIRTFL